MNEATANWLFAPDAASAAQARTILDNQTPSSIAYAQQIANLHGAFGADFGRIYPRLCVYKVLAQRGKIAG